MATTRSQVGAVIVRAVVLMPLLIVLNPRLALGENALALSIEIDAEATGGAGPMTAMVNSKKLATSIVSGMPSMLPEASAPALTLSAKSGYHCYRYGGAGFQIQARDQLHVR